MSKQKPIHKQGDEYTLVTQVKLLDRLAYKPGSGCNIIDHFDARTLKVIREILIENYREVFKRITGNNMPLAFVRPALREILFTKLNKNEPIRKNARLAKASRKK